MVTNSISKPTLMRLPMYYHYLIKLRDAGVKNISCTTIATALGLVPIQVRKDLQNAGAVGKPKVGHDVSNLVSIIQHTLGYNNSNDAFLVGAGNLGQALIGYKEFEKYGMEIVAAFDTSVLKIGNMYFGKTVFSTTKFKDLAKRMNIKIGIIATPSKYAQNIADMMIDAGIIGIWNFAPVHLIIPEGVFVQNENLAVSLSVLLNKIR